MVSAMVKMKFFSITFVLAVIVSSSECQDQTVFEFLPLGNVSTVVTDELGHFDDSVSQVIHIPGGFPFGNRNHNQVYIGANGYFSFEEPFYSASPVEFPGTTVSAYYIVAPFWDDVDIRRRGNIFFEVHTSNASSSLFSKVNNFIAPEGSFTGTWMVVAQWDMVHSWPDGESDGFRQFALAFLGVDSSLVNTFQAILITDGTASYTVFTYRCGSMQWSLNGATIGYNAAGDYFENHPNTGSFVSHEIACLNSPGSEWFNVVYNISVDTPGTLAPPPTVEPAQLSYLDYLTYGSNYLERCRNCSSPPILLDGPGLPFGSYYHDTVYVGNNGIFSFGEPLLENSPAEFPTQQASTYYAYIVAPFWSDIDTRLNGSVRWQVYSPDGDDEDVLISRVEEFINIELGQDSITNANWMLVATWVGVHPFPHGNSVEEDRLDPYLQRENTFQGIIISNGTKVYAVFTYVCEDMEWSDAAVVGYNAGGEPYQNHPLSGKLESKLIGCVHAPGTQSNNVVYDLSEGVTNGTTPEPFDTVGTCAGAGYTECCDFNVDNCFGSAPADCFCDVLCLSFGDCCRDQPDLCQTDFTTSNETYLLYSDHFYIGRLSLDGEIFDTLPLTTLRDASVLDFDYARDFLYWYDNVEEGIFRSGLDGSDLVKLVNTSSLGVIEDLAVDWVSNKLYWTETLYRRIEVLDLETLVVAPVLDADPHSGIRGIAVDPTTRYMYWTDWGEPAKIERSSMDGADRTILHSTGLGEPNGITIDYQTQTIYWTDSVLGVIDYSNTDGTNRRRLQTNLPYPYAITIEGSLVFFTDWIDVGVHATHKLDGDNVTKFVNAFTIRPAGIEVIASNRQAEGIDMCDVGTGCDHMCLLSSTDARGYSCICKEGYVLDSDGQNCTFVSIVEPPEFGTCGAAAYNECCSGGYCAGSPPNCFCDTQCHSRGDCCIDIGDTCPVEPSSCSAAGYDTCCTNNIFGCSGVSDGTACYCDESCRSFGDCCDDFDTICPLPTTEPPPTLFPPINDTSVFQFLTLNNTAGVTAEFVGHFDDGVSHAILIPQGFPFGDLHHAFIFISTNGIISFSEPFYVAGSQLFPGFSTTVSDSYLVAPFWSDVDIRLSGDIKYEVHSNDTGLVGSAELLKNISDFISIKASVEFIGSWMLVVSWEDVHPWPNGEGNAFLNLIYPDFGSVNSFQGIIITDGVNSYSLFTYKCGEMEWSRQGVIGFNAAGQSYENHPLSSEVFIGVPPIACSNSANSEWTNVVYKLKVTNSTAPPTVEPPQSSYLGMLDYIASGNVPAFLDPCQNCTSGAISIPDFPFGDYFHNTVYVGTNGIISFSQEFHKGLPEAFPSETDLTVYRSFLVAPYWSNIDTRLDGRVSYQILVSSEGGSEVSNRFEQVSSFINSESDPNFAGATWMLVATWYNVHPDPHGDSAEQDRQDPYLQSTNNFQAVLISNGTKAYSIFTYECDTMEWSGEATIGINAGGSWYRSHPLSGRVHSNAIDCVHTSTDQSLKINNVVYDLAPVVPVGTVPPPIERLEIPFVIGTSGIPTLSVPRFDDGASDAIEISLQGGFPFANSYQTVVYVGTNGIISFEEPFISHTPMPFPTVSPVIYDRYLLAPFWADTDISFNVGNVKYEVHATASNITGSIDLIGRVSNFISNKTETTFEGSWMLVALWDEVPPYAGFFVPGPERNSFQAIAITNGAESYALYTYKCGAMEWSEQGVIGYNGGSPTDYFFSHPLSGTDDAQTIACLEFPDSEWTNLLYNISIDEVVTSPPPVIVEPGQSSYLMFINKTGINQVVLQSCDDCYSDFVSLPDVPFGNYRHSEAYISTNGIISFGSYEVVTVPVPSLFPSTISLIHFGYIIAPYWADIDTTHQGEIWYETHIRGDDRISNDLLDKVSGFVNEQTEASGFSGTWMLVATWDAVRPYSGQSNEFITDENTFQAVVITNGSKTYTVFTYKCDLLTWSEEATIGYNAASDYFQNHPLGGTTVTDALDCVHSSTDGSEWNNVVYDLVPGTVIDGPTPESPNSFGSCIEAGYTSCCTSFNCMGSPTDCFCDRGCYQFGDCCHDIEDICNAVTMSVNATLLIATQYSITLLNGSQVDNLLPVDFNSYYTAIDYDYNRGYIYFSDIARSQILRVNFAGSNKLVIVDTFNGTRTVDGIAVDWVSNKLYWTDAFYLTVEVIDLASFERKTLFSLASGSTPRAIVVDPATSYMYWTDWGSPAMIERASMDGSNRQVLHNTGLVWPNGLTIDYADQRIYWADASLDRIEYSNVDGSERVILETEANGLSHPFGITLDNNVLYWSDWLDQTIFSTHKLIGQNIVPIYENIPFLPSGVVAVSASRQSAMINNPCEDHTCSHLCLLSTITPGYTCACPDGEQLLANGIDCTNVGSCASAGYTGCCNSGVCSGDTGTCYCEIECVVLGDCCSDFFDLYVPVPIGNLEVLPLGASSLNVTWSQTADLQVCSDAYTRVKIVDYNGEVIFNGTVTPEVTFLVVNQGLAKWIPYTVAVKSGNLLTTSETITTVVFTEEGVPSVSPQNISIDWISPTDMTVSWEPLTLIEARGFVASYVITYSPVNIASTKKRQTGGGRLVVPGNTSQVTIGNLEEGTAYSVSVRSSTRAGVGVSSDLLSSGIGPAATGAPNVGASTGGIAAGVIVVLIAVAVVSALLVGLFLLMKRKRNKYNVTEEYAHFTNEDESVTLSRSASRDMPITSTQQVPALSFGDEPTYQEIQKGGFDNPGYETLREETTETEAQYASIGEVPPLYDDVLVNRIVSEEPRYQVVGKLQVQSGKVENKQDLAEMEKQDLGSVPPARKKKDTKK